MSPYYSDDERSIGSYDAVSPAQHNSSVSFALVKDLASKIPGKKSLDDDEMPDVLYTAQYISSDGLVLGTRQGASPPEEVVFDTGDDKTDGKKPVIEIVTRIPATSEQVNNAARRRRPRIRINTPDCYMIIHSSHIRAALAAVMGYYPVPDREIDAPFQILVHRWKALEQYKLNQPACHDPEYAATASRHIDVLLAFLKDKYAEKLALEASRWNRPSGPTATYDLFWVLLAPGEIVYREKDGQMVPYVISEVNQSTDHDDTQNFYNIYLWNIRFTNGRMRRHTDHIVVHAWNGEQLIQTLPVIPARFVPGGTRAMAEEQIKLGKMFWELAKQPAYKEYDGPLVYKDNKKGGRMTGRVIVDCEGFSLYGDGPFKPQNPFPHHPPPPVHPRGQIREHPLPQVQSRCTCKACGKAENWQEPSPWAGFDHLDPRSDNPPPNEDLYFHLIGPTIPAFILGQRRWAHIRLAGITNAHPDQDAFKYLVLDPEVKLTIKAMMGKFANLDGKLAPWPADFVKNKGEGRIFLLHGSPGVGKTCTAECAAELARRPLLALTSGDISTSMSVSRVEEALSYFLNLGERFGALVLLDEADVYLERRRSRDLQRNGLVSVFLRALEYYRGVLFLTTNRVEAFDDAFTSRIHVALHYKRLGDEERQRIWMHNFERLERDSSQKVLVPLSTRTYAFECPDVHKLQWNGREIRNALQTAVALAETEALESGVETVAVSERHLRAVVRMSGGFKDFLRECREEREEGERRRERKGKGEAEADKEGASDGEEEVGCAGFFD